MWAADDCKIIDGRKVYARIPARDRIWRRDDRTSRYNVLKRVGRRGAPIKEFSIRKAVRAVQRKGIWRMGDDDDPIEVALAAIGSTSVRGQLITYTAAISVVLDSYVDGDLAEFIRVSC